MYFVFFAIGKILSLALFICIIPFVTRLALNTGVIYLLQTVSNENLCATFTFVWVLHISFLTLDALVVFLILTVLYFGNAERMFVQSSQISFVWTYYTIDWIFLVLQTLRLVSDANRVFCHCVARLTRIARSRWLREESVTIRLTIFILQNWTHFARYTFFIFWITVAQKFGLLSLKF